MNELTSIIQLLFKKIIFQKVVRGKTNTLMESRGSLLMEQNKLLFELQVDFNGLYETYKRRKSRNVHIDEFNRL